MSAQEWIYGLTLYFVGIFVLISLFSIAGVTSSVSISGRYSPSIASNDTRPGTVSYSDSFSIGKYFKDIFSFFVFNISITDSTSGLFQYLWLIRIIFVYLPLTFLFLAIYYSLPTISGGAG